MSRIGKITIAMLGSVRAPRLKAKAAETRHLFPLMKELLAQYGFLFGVRSRHLVSTVNGILDFYAVCSSEPRDMSSAGLRRLQASIPQSCNAWKKYEGKLVFKWHMFFHIGERAEQMGNPRMHWTYPDEDLNRHMGRVAKALHKGPNFYLSFLQRVLIDVC